MHGGRGVQGQGFQPRNQPLRRGHEWVQVEEEGEGWVWHQVAQGAVFKTEAEANTWARESVELEARRAQVKKGQRELRAEEAARREKEEDEEARAEREARAEEAARLKAAAQLVEDGDEEEEEGQL